MSTHVRSSIFLLFCHLPANSKKMFSHQTRVLKILSNWPQPAEMMLDKPLSIKKCCYICQCLDFVDMHLFAKFDQYIPCGLRVMTIFSLTANGRMEGRTHIVSIVQTQGSWYRTNYYITINDTTFELSVFWPSDTESWKPNQRTEVF